MGHRVAEGIPSYLVMNHWTGHSQPTEGTHLCMGGQAKWVRCTNMIPEEQTLEGSETEEAPQSVNCPSLAQHQTGETP